MNIELAEAREKLELLDQLEACPGFTDLLLPRLRKLAKDEAEACIDRTLTPEKRAEHVEAAHILRELCDFTKSERARLEGKVKEAKKSAVR